MSFGSIALLVFADASLSFALKTYTNEPDETGTLAGQIVFYSEILICGSIWLWGMVSDRIGRRWVFAVGTFLIAVAFVAMPFASNYYHVLGIRLVFAPGAAAVSAMLMALICDYPRDDQHSRSRGKASAIMGILAGLGAIFALFGLVKVPEWVSGTSQQDAFGGMVMFFVAAGVALVCGIVAFFGLAKQGPTNQYNHANAVELVTSGFKAMSDPYVVLAYLASFSARGDSSIVTLFLAAWIQSYAMAHNVPKATAFAQAGVITGIIQVVALVSAPFIGILADKFSRAAVTMCVSLVGLVGYLLLGLLSDPYDWSIQLAIAVVLLGVGEMGILIMSQSILGLHAPTETRGSISGFWSLCGSLGIMFGSGVGSILYTWNRGGPFFIFAIFNGIVASFAFVLFIREKVRGTGEVAILVHDNPNKVKEGKPLLQEQQIQ